MRTPDQLEALFRQRGMKVTEQRRHIFRLLAGNDAHPTADAVYAAARREMPNLSLRTVYQTLSELADMGELLQLDLGTGSARFDPNVEPHHHLVCTDCGKVRDFYADATSLGVPDPGDVGFCVDSTEIVFRGRCAPCAGLGQSLSATRS